MEQDIALLLMAYSKEDLARKYDSAQKEVLRLEEENKKLNKEMHALAKNAIVLPCKVGQTVYKICPKCNERHSGSCEHCAWRGCIGYGCDIGVRVYSDGSYNKHDLQIVPRKVSRYTIVTILELWNIMYFATEEEALAAMTEYDAIRKIEDRHERYEAYKAWEAKREMHYAFLEDEEK